MAAQFHKLSQLPEAADRNRKLTPIRSRIEKIFGTWKRSYRFRSMRWIGLAKAKLQTTSPPSLTTSSAIWWLKTA